MSQPVAQKDKQQQTAYPGGSDHYAEALSRIFDAIGDSGIQGGPEGKAKKVGGQHDGKGVRAGGQKLDNGLGPDHFVAQRHAAGQTIENDGDAGRGRERFGYRLSVRLWGLYRLAAKKQCNDGHDYVHDSRAQPRADHTESGNTNKYGGEYTPDRPDRVGCVQAAGCLSHAAVIRCRRPQQGRQRAPHQYPREGRPAETAASRPKRRPIPATGQKETHYGKAGRWLPAPAGQCHPPVQQKAGPVWPPGR